MIQMRLATLFSTNVSHLIELSDADECDVEKKLKDTDDMKVIAYISTTR